MRAGDARVWAAPLGAAAVSGRPRGGVTVLVVVALAGLATAPAAADAEGLSIRVPGSNALVAGRSLRVDVRLPRGTRRVQAWVNTRNVTRRLRRSPRRLSGRVPRRLLRRGLNDFGVRARGRSGRLVLDHARFVLSRKSRRLLRVFVRRSHRAESPVRVRVRARPRKTSFRARLNGRRVHRLFSRPRGRRRAASLSVSDGLRYGRNTLRVVVYRADGRYQRVVRRFRVRRTAPLAGAGVDRMVLRGRPARLDARRSRALRRGDELIYRWRLVRRPRDSRAVLRGRNRTRPLLRPDVRGIYRLRLTVRGLRRGAAARVPAQGAGPSVASDVVTLAAQEESGPTGVPLGVAVYEPGTFRSAIQVGTTYYEPPDPGNIDNAYQVLELDRGTLGLIKNSQFYVGQESQLAAYLLSRPSSELVVFTNLTELPGLGSLDPLNSVITALGGEPLAQSEAQTLSGLSVVGIPGTRQGQSYVRTAQGIDPLGTRITGLLQQGIAADALTNDYVFTPGDYVAFDLGSDTEPVRIGPCQTQPPGPQCVSVQDPLPAGQAGFQVVVLDAESLTLEAHQSFATNSSGNDKAGQQAMASFLAQYSHDKDKLVIVKSLGSPHPTPDAWTPIAQQIDALGGSLSVFHTFNQPGPSGSGKTTAANYQLIGGAGIEAEEAVGGSSSNPLDTSGMLARNSQWRFQRLLADPAGQSDFSLLPIAYQAPTPFPYSGVDPQSGIDYTNVEQYISCALGVGLGYDSNVVVGPIRDYYWQSTTIVWAGHLDDLNDLQYSPSTYPQCEPLSATDQQGLAPLKTQLATEWSLVGDLNGWFGAIFSPLTAAAGVQQVDISTITNAIKSAVDPPDEGIAAEVFGILAQIAEIGASVAPIFGEPAPHAAARPPSSRSVPRPGAQAAQGSPLNPAAVNAGALGGLSGAFALASIFLDDSDGNRLLEEIQTKADDLADDVAYSYAHADLGLGQVQKIIASDWGKLKTVAHNADTGVWAWPGANNAPLGAFQTLTTTTRQLAYETLMPLAYLPEAIGFPVQPIFGCQRPAVSNVNDNEYQYVTAIEPGGSAGFTLIANQMKWTSREDPDNTAPESLSSAIFAAPTFYPPNESSGSPPTAGEYRPHFWEQNFGSNIKNCP